MIIRQNEDEETWNYSDQSWTVSKLLYFCNERLPYFTRSWTCQTDPKMRPFIFMVGYYDTILTQDESHLIIFGSGGEKLENRRSLTVKHPLSKCQGVCCDFDVALLQFGDYCIPADKSAHLYCLRILPRSWLLLFFVFLLFCSSPSAVGKWLWILTSYRMWSFSNRLGWRQIKIWKSNSIYNIVSERSEINETYNCVSVVHTTRSNFWWSQSDLVSTLMMNFRKTTSSITISSTISSLTQRINAKRKWRQGKVFIGIENYFLVIIITLGIGIVLGILSAS